jgi:hypothetical protein
LSDPTAATPTPVAPAGPRPKYKRKLSNYLLDKKLQLRYILVVTILSGLIAGVLGFMIYDQRRESTQSIEDNLQELVKGGDDRDVQNITGDYESEDRLLVYEMVGVGCGLVVILSLFLVIMTHKVAGPLFKVSMYFDRMSDGKLGVVTPLRQGDMLQDFYANFKDMHDAVRVRANADINAMDKAGQALRASGNQGDYRGDAYARLVEELDKLEQHVAKRRELTDASPPRSRPLTIPPEVLANIRKQARTALIAGILAMVVIPIVFAPLALIRAARVRRDVLDYHGGNEYLSMANVATILGWVSLSLWMIFVFVFFAIRQ